MIQIYYLYLYLHLNIDTNIVLICVILKQVFTQLLINLKKINLKFLIKIVNKSVEHYVNLDLHME